MKILSAYLAKEFFKLFILCQSVFLFIYLVIDFLQKIDNFIEAQAPKGVVLFYFLYKIPFIAVNMVPPATAIAVIVMFSVMRKKNEITALKACGVNVFRLSRTLGVVSFLVGVAMFLFSETVVPYASFRSNRLWNIDVEKRDLGLFYGSNQIWYRGPDRIYWIRNFDSRKQIMESPSFYFFDKTFRLTKKIDGRTGLWEKGRWTIKDGIVQEATEEGNYQLRRFDSLHLELPETPDAFRKGLKKPEEMSYWRLKRYAEMVRQEGYDNARYLVDMNIKIAFPFIILVLVIIGIPIALGLKGGGTPLAVSAGIGVCFLYVLVLGLSRSLGLSGVLPPMLSAWLANLVFSLFGIYLMMHLER
jgi:lipopolysaccharide export system permease protein